MYKGLLDLHSLLRYFTVILLFLSVFRSLSGWLNKKPYTSLDNKLSLFTMIALHLQLLVGITLYFVSPVISAALQDFSYSMQNAELRFWALEHISMMLVGIILITVGRIVSKKAATDLLKHKKQAILFLIGLLIIFVAIPWPFSSISRPWF